MTKRSDRLPWRYAPPRDRGWLALLFILGVLGAALVGFLRFVRIAMQNGALSGQQPAEPITTIGDPVLTGTALTLLAATLGLAIIFSARRRRGQPRTVPFLLTILAFAVLTLNVYLVVG